MAGYSLWKAKMRYCDQCKSHLMYATLPQTEIHTFLTPKTQKLENALVHPTELTENPEILFVRVFDVVKHMSVVCCHCPFVGEY